MDDPRDTPALGKDGKPDPEYRREYYLSHESYYWEVTKTEGYPYEIMIGIDAVGGGTAGEFGIRWHNLGSVCSPRLEIFNDAWWILEVYPEFFKDLGAIDCHREPSDSEKGVQLVVELLKRHGFVDTTKRVGPRERDEVANVLGALDRLTPPEAGRVIDLYQRRQRRAR